MAQLVEGPTSALVIISVCEFDPCVGSVLTTKSLEAASDSVSPYLFSSPTLIHSLSLSKTKQNKKTKKQ